MKYLFRYPFTNVCLLLCLFLLLFFYDLCLLCCYLCTRRRQIVETIVCHASSDICHFILAGSFSFLFDIYVFLSFFIKFLFMILLMFGWIWSTFEKFRLKAVLRIWLLCINIIVMCFGIYVCVITFLFCFFVVVCFGYFGAY